MNCSQVQAYLHDLICTGSDPAVEPGLAAHAAACPACKHDYDAAMRALVLLQPSEPLTMSANLKERIMNKIAACEEKGREHTQSKRMYWSRWKPVLAAGVAAALVIVMAPFLLIKSTPVAYALELAMKANEGLQSIHIRITPQSFNSVNELWAQFDDMGELEHLRMNFPDTDDGPKDIVWAEDKAQIWFKAKGGAATVVEKRLIDSLKISYGQFDPKFIVQEIYKKCQNGSLDIEVTEPTVPGDPIVIRASSEKMPGRQEVLSVDAETHLLLQRDTYQLNDGQYELIETWEYLDYNEPIDPAVFVLDLPPDTMIVDQTTQEVGLAQGDLSDKEVAKEVAQQFFTAWSTRDYATMSKLFSGIPVAKAKEICDNITVLRVNSIGEPEFHEKTGALRVPCKIEAQRRGETAEVDMKPLVRQVYQQPGKWEIIGGI